MLEWCLCSKHMKPIFGLPCNFLSPQHKEQDLDGNPRSAWCVLSIIETLPRPALRPPQRFSQKRKHLHQSRQERDSTFSKAIPTRDLCLPSQPNTISDVPRPSGWSFPLDVSSWFAFLPANYKFDLRQNKQIAIQPEMSAQRNEDWTEQKEARDCKKADRIDKRQKRQSFWEVHMHNFCPCLQVPLRHVRFWRLPLKAELQNFSVFFRRFSLKESLGLKGLGGLRRIQNGATEVLLEHEPTQMLQSQIVSERLNN